ncbi:MAG: hypothetical protein GX548_10590 [Lentisphaerae bacterium]|nr:hypothetical protein [Lentisphaerota bacterium]
MKIIGKLEGGDRLVVMNAGEVAACETIARGVFQMAAHEVDERKNPPPAARTPPERGPGKARSKIAPRLCLECGTPITGNLRGGRKVHKGACRRAWSARLAKKCRAPIAEARAPEGNPADPSLTPEQREALHEKRLALIKASAERIG